MKKIFLLVILLFSYCFAYSKNIIYTNPDSNIMIGNYLEIFEDPSNALTIHDVIKLDKFQPSKNDVPNLSISASTFWVKFSITNQTDVNQLLLEYNQAFIDEIVIYEIFSENNLRFKSHTGGDHFRFNAREYDYQNYIFNLNIPKGTTKFIYVKIKSGEQILLPFKIGTIKTILESHHNSDIIFGIYCGIILVMFFYNLFIYFTLKDSLYLKYVLYILAIGMTQASLLGYPFQYLWPAFPWFANQSVYLFSCMVSISALEFVKSFLQTKVYSPALHKISYLFTSAYIMTALLSLFNFFNISYFFVLSNAALVAIFMLITAIDIYRKGYKPAKFFLIAWSSMLIGIIIYVLKDFNIFPTNIFTSYTMPAGSAIEVILLSFALADRINVLKKEKEESQAQALDALLQNELIIRNQNIVLENRVEERTKKLKLINEELSTTLSELKHTQSQLVNSEKMASLGQLTAGIAHEINNPINFVVSNVKPLNRDIEDIYELIHRYDNINIHDSDTINKIIDVRKYREEIDYEYLKQEIGYMLKGIEDGAVRTADIVKGLRVFSRLDENDLKRTDITEGIGATLTLLNPEIGSIELIKNFENLPKIECFPGKLNQVFMNILNNAIYAIKENIHRTEKGKLEITTTFDELFVYIGIKDNGIGMSEEVRGKIFDPFFTTKPVGKGTGLGMSITFSIINDHHGTIDLHTEYGVGSEFIIKLPIDYKN